MAAEADILIIGAGHNGLVCAYYLAARGLKVTLLERREIVGGAAVTETFAPGFRNSTASYTVSLLNPKIIRDMALYDHGLRVVLRKVDNFLPTLGPDYLLGGRDGLTRSEIARHSARDAAAYDAYSASLESVVAVLRQWILRTPPNAGGGLGEMLPLLQLGAGLNRLALEEQRHLYDFFTKSAADILERISSRIWSRRCSVSMPWSAIMRALARRAPLTSCYTMCSARRRVCRAPGGTRWAAWARSRRPWQKRVATKGWRSSSTNPWRR
jgi:phytoene dehydrogenase-like protein